MSSLYEEGPCVNWVVYIHRPVMAGAVGLVAAERCSSLYRLLDGEDKADGSSLRWRISLGTELAPFSLTPAGEAALVVSIVSIAVFRWLF